jgi:hypothetical protein
LFCGIVQGVVAAGAVVVGAGVVAEPPDVDTVVAVLAGVLFVDLEPPQAASARTAANMNTRRAGTVRFISSSPKGPRNLHVDGSPDRSVFGARQ